MGATEIRVDIYIISSLSGMLNYNCLGLDTTIYRSELCLIVISLLVYKNNREEIMLNYLFQLPDIYVFILFSCLCIISSIFFVFLASRFMPLNLRYKDNPVVGVISSLIGIIYGVLAGLTALYLINNISYTGDAIQHEANAVANIYRDSKWLQEPTQTQIKDSMKKYLEKVIHIEWPLMESGDDVGDEGDLIINTMSDFLHNYKINNNSELLIIHDLLEEIKTLYNARHQRIQMSYSELNAEMWIVILIGTILMIGINVFFRMNLYLHVICISAAALMASSMLFLLVSLDKPFQGEFIIEPSAFRSILISIMNNNTKPNTNEIK